MRKIVFIWVFRLSKWWDYDRKNFKMETIIHESKDHKNIPRLASPALEVNRKIHSKFTTFFSEKRGGRNYTS